MNVDVSAVGIPVASLFASEPEDAADNGVAARSIGSKNLTGALTALENSPGRGATTEFTRHFHTPEWGVFAATAVSEAEFGSGNRVGLDRLAFPDEKHLLILDADDHPITRASRAATI